MNILLLEDHLDGAALLKMLLSSEGHNVLHVTTLDEARTQLVDFHPDVLICDLHIGDGSSIDLLPHAPANAKRILTTGSSRADVWSRCEAAGFEHYLQKPLDFDRLLAIIPSARG